MMGKSRCMRVVILSILCMVCALMLMSCETLTTAKEMEIANKICQQNGGVVSLVRNSDLYAYPLEIWCLNGARFDADGVGDVYNDYTKKEKDLTTRRE